MASQAGEEAGMADDGRDKAGSAGSARASKPAKKRFSDLPKRIASGAVYLIAFLACLYLGPISTMVLIAVVSGLCAYEFYRMMRISGLMPISVLGIVFAICYPITAFIGGQTLMLGLTFILLGILALWYVIYPRVRVTDISVTLFGAVYTGLMLSSFVLVRDGITGYSGGAVALVVFVSVVINDSFAYLVGSRFGRHKLVPRISPNKSWEGFLGGLAGSMLVWLALPFIPAVDVSVVEALVMGAVCGVVGLLGDLTESRIKRGAGVKDAGTIMPGHGGMFDRVDSLILVSFVSYLMLKLLGVL